MGKKSFIGQIQEFNRYAEGTIKEEFKLDLIDKKIMYLLCENARLSHTSIAKKLRIKRETVGYRIKRMMENDFLHGYLTLLNHRKLGFRNYLVYLKLKTVTQEKEFLNFLFNFNEITRLKNCSGSYDVQMIASVKKEEEFTEIFEKIVDNYNHIIKNYDIFEILEENFLGLNFFLEGTEDKNLTITEHKGSTFQKEFEKIDLNGQDLLLDEKDKLILEHLKLDANLSIKDLSNKINIAPIAIENRIKKMIQNDIIKKFYPVASLSKLGYQWWKVLLKVKSLDKQKFLTYLKYHANVPWYMRLLGKWDYQFSVFAKDNAEFHKILDEIRSEFADNIIDHDSVIIFNQFKHIQRVN